MLDATAAAYALLLGMVAAFNPCGFALLPAYITVLVTGSADEGVTRAMALRRATMFGLAMTTGFMAIFTGVGLLFGAVNVALQGDILPYVSYVTVVLGAAVVWLGVILLRGGELKGPGLRMNNAAPRATFWSQTVYGVAFAVASLSCTIGLFLFVVTQALAATNPIGAVAPFVIYGAGMGTSILVVSLTAAIAGSGVASALRRRTGTLMRVGGALMILAGLYVVIFGLAEVLPQFGIRALDEVLRTTSAWQSSIIGSITTWGTPVLIGLVVLALGAAVWVLARNRSADAVAVRPASAANALAGQSTPSATPTVASAATLDAVRRATKSK